MMGRLLACLDLGLGIPGGAEVVNRWRRPSLAAEGPDLIPSTGRIKPSGLPEDVVHFQLELRDAAGGHPLPPPEVSDFLVQPAARRVRRRLERGSESTAARAGSESLPEPDVDHAARPCDGKRVHSAKRIRRRRS